MLISQLTNPLVIFSYAINGTATLSLHLNPCGERKFLFHDILYTTYYIRFCIQRAALATPPFWARSISLITSARVAILVSPGVVPARAPWAAANSTAS